MRNIVLAAIACMASLVGTAHANDIEACEVAMTKDDRVGAKFFAQTLLVFSPAETEAERDRALRCLEFAFGTPYRFNERNGSYEKGRAAANGRDRALAMVDELAKQIEAHAEDVREAQADVYSDCARAIEANDKINATRLANSMLSFNIMPSGDRLALALECLEFAKGEPYTFDLIESAFVAQSRSDEIEAERAEIDRQKQNQKKLREEQDALRVLQIAQFKREEAKQRAEVIARVAEACNRMYKRRPDETVTNPVCLDVFLSSGLPE